MNDEKFKLILISQTARNFIVMISQVNNNYQYITMFTSTFSINTSTSFNYTLSTLFSYVTSTFFAFLLSLSSVTSIFVNELTIDSTAQEIRLSNASSVENVKIELKRALNHYAKLRSAKNSSMNLLTGLAALLSYNSIVVKIVLTLFVKAFFTNSHESKLYKKAIVDTQYKIN